MIELALQVASGLIIFIVCMFAWSSTRLVEEKKKRKKDRDSDLKVMADLVQDSRSPHRQE